MTIAEARARLAEAQRWWMTYEARAAQGIKHEGEVRARLDREVREAATALKALEDAPREAAWAAASAARAAERAAVAEAERAARIQREIERAEQLHRGAVKVARVRKAEALRKAAWAAGRRDAHQVQARRVAEAWRVLQAAEVAARAATAGCPTEVLQRSQDVRVPYTVNFRETCADDAYYVAAIEPYTWRRGRGPILCPF